MTSGAGSLWPWTCSARYCASTRPAAPSPSDSRSAGWADVAYGDGFIRITDEPTADGGQEHLDKIDPSRDVIVQVAPIPGAGPACAASRGTQGIWIGCADVDRITLVTLLRPSVC
jgi:hypothetical protein